LVNKVLFSHKTDDYITPDWLITKLKEEFDFVLDACSIDSNPTEMPNWYTIEDDGLTNQWYTWTYCNPPYSEVDNWVMKAHMEADKGNYSVMLIPARTDTKWFHKIIYKKYEIRFLEGRLRFEGTEHSAPFPSMLVIFR
jgi:site-specific DNA-methyltransferase (adenine-specific)